MSDFQGSIDHSGEYYHISHGDYGFLLDLDKNEMTMLGVIEVSYDANIRALLRDEQRGRNTRPRYRRVEDIPEELRYISLSFSEMRRRSINLCAESSFKHATPALEKRGFIKTRFVRFEGGRVTKVYPCTGQCKSDNGSYWLNLYDWQGDDPREVVRACVRQYLLCPDAINRAKRAALGTVPPDGPDDPKGDDDAPYYFEDIPETDAPDGQSVGKNTDLPCPTAPAQEAPVGKNTDRTSFSATDGGKFTGSVGKNTASGGKFTGSVGKNTGSLGKSTDSNKVVITKNQNNNSKKGRGSATSLLTSQICSDQKKQNAALPPGPISTEMVYCVLAHYLGEPKDADYDKCMVACSSLCSKLQAMQLDEYPRLYGTFAARSTLIRTTLFMMLADPDCWSGPRRPWLSAWKIDQYFEEYAGKAAGWLPPEEYLADLDTPEESKSADRLPVNPTVNQVDAAPPPVQPVPVTEVAPTAEEQECRNLGIATRYAPALRRLAAHGYYVGMYPDGGYALIDAHDQRIAGREHIEPKDLWMIAATIGRVAS